MSPQAPTAALVRRDIWTLEDERRWHPVTQAYAHGIAALKQRADDDPTSWAYQASVHGVAEETPDEFRGQCQHNSWFFLPWHRMYLHWFERMIRAAIRDHDAVPDDVAATWALPYWNYGRGGRTPRLPAAFRQQTMPDGTRNPLFVRERDRNINRGGALPALAISADRTLAETRFSRRPAPGRTAGFGGQVTAWHHFAEIGATPGALENTPHNGVHGLVGGPEGFMSGFDTAPLDPVFWMHHANIDRLWSVWRRQPNRRNPRDRRWRTFTFRFHAEDGSEVEMTPADVVDSAPQLGYRYDDEPVPEPSRRDVMPDEEPEDEQEEQPPELVGASEEGMALTGERTSVAFPVTAPRAPARRGPAAGPGRVYLNVEGIEAERNPGVSYAVFLNLPDDEDPDTEPERHHVGNLSFFGIELAAREERREHGAHGMRQAFDITDLVEELRAAGRWREDEVSVTFSPLRAGPPEEPEDGEEPEERGAREPAREEPQVPVRVGRIGVYYE